MVVGDAHVFPGFLTPVLMQLFFPKPRLLFSHASAGVRGENMLERKFAGDWTHNHQVTSPTRSALSNPGFPNKPCFLHICSTNVFKTLWKKEKLLVTSNFSFYHSVFSLFAITSAIFIKFEIVICLQAHSVWKSLKFVVWERVNTIFNIILVM